MDAVTKRAAGTDNAGARETFAALSFIRNDPALKDSLLSKVDSGTQEIAKTEWVDSALSGNYDPILGATNAEEAPELANVNSLAMPDAAAAAILGAMAGSDLAGGELFGGEDGTLAGQGNIGLQARPVIASADSKGADKFGTDDDEDDHVIFDPSATIAEFRK